MNCLLLFPEEITKNSSVIVTGQRREHFLQAHQLQAGMEVRAAVWGVGLGTAKVLAIDSDKINLSISALDAAPTRCPIELIVAVPRPQTVKKIIQISTMLGISKVYLIQSSGVVKSYLQSKALLAENILAEQIKGLEQAVDAVAPEVIVEPNYGDFIKNKIPVLCQKNKTLLFADTRGPNFGLLDREQLKLPALLAVGPESGWSDRERQDFAELGFKSVGLGPRMLRVEVAVTAVIAALTSAL